MKTILITIKFNFHQTVKTMNWIINENLIHNAISLAQTNNMQKWNINKRVIFILSENCYQGKECTLYNSKNLILNRNE